MLWFNQLISEPTYLLPTSRPCIDLLFTINPNMVMNSGDSSKLPLSESFS